MGRDAPPPAGGEGAARSTERTPRCPGWTERLHGEDSGLQESVRAARRPRLGRGMTPWSRSHAGPGSRRFWGRAATIGPSHPVEGGRGAGPVLWVLAVLCVLCTRVL